MARQLSLCNVRISGMDDPKNVLTETTELVFLETDVRIVAQALLTVVPTSYEIPYGTSHRSTTGKRCESDGPRLTRREFLR